MKFIEVLIILIIIVASLNEASHFRGGSITAIPYSYNSTSVTMSITAYWAWRLSYNPTTYCGSTTISSGILMGVGDNIICLRNCFQLNAIIGTTTMKCTAYSSLNDWSYGSKTWLYTFPLSNVIEFSYSGTAWATLIVGSGAWSVKYTMNTLNRTDIGKVNSSPNTLLAPMIVVRQGFAYGIQIPTLDADSNDTVKCRWSQSALNECGGICQSVPFGVLNSSCYFYINATQAVVGLYAAAIQIEDFAPAISTTQALSSVPIQFVVWIKYINSSCTTSPTIVGDLPLDACIVANKDLTTRIVANESCSPSERISDIVILSFTSLVSSTLTQLNSSKWYKNITWIPPTPIIGINSYFVCSTATNTALLSSTTSCITFITGLTEPRVVESSLSPTNVYLTTIFGSSDTYTFSCLFNVDVVKPSVSSYIRVYSAQTKLQVYSLDTTAVSSNIQFLTTKNMSFTIPIGSLTNDSYYILFDWGVAVYNQYCKPLTYPITNTSLWIFTVVTFTSSTTSTTTNTNTTPTLSTITTSTNTSTPSTSTTTTTNTTIIIVFTVTTNNTSVLSNLSFTNTYILLSSDKNNSILSFCNQWWHCVFVGIGAFLVLAGLIGSAIIWHKIAKTAVNEIKFEYKTLIHDETLIFSSPICILAIHDIGCDRNIQYIYIYHKQIFFKILSILYALYDLKDSHFDAFIKSEQMLETKYKYKWLCINLPGQEAKAKDLKLNYPSLIEIADDIVKLLDANNIDQVICIGEGIGANICTLFALNHSTRCKALCLIRPNGTISSLNENLAYIADYLDTNKKNNIEEIIFAYIVQHRFDIKITNERIIDRKTKLKINEFKTNEFSRRNLKNVFKLVNVFLNRTSLIDHLKDLSLPILIVYNKQVAYINKSKRFHRRLVDLGAKQLYLYETDHLVDPLEDLGFSVIFKQFLNKSSKKPSSISSKNINEKQESKNLNIIGFKGSIIFEKQKKNIINEEKESSNVTSAKKNINKKQESKNVDIIENDIGFKKSIIFEKQRNKNIDSSNVTSAKQAKTTIDDKKETNIINLIDDIEKLIFESNQRKARRGNKNKAKININNIQDDSFLSSSDIFLNASFNSANNLI